LRSVIALAEKLGVKHCDKCGQKICINLDNNKHI
jgi:hypothetical protein